MNLQQTTGYKTITHWLEQKDLHPFPFQEEAWTFIHQRESGLVNAPTGCGKTYSVFLGAVIQFINQFPDTWHQHNNN